MNKLTKDMINVCGVQSGKMRAAEELMIEFLSHCLKCGSGEIEQWGESGHYWVHCHKCDHDHDDDTDIVRMDENHMDNGPFYSETQKVRPLVEKYFEGKKFVLDYGCGSTLITPEAKGIDLVYKDKVTSFVLKDLNQVYDFGHEQGWQNKVDGIFSSHFLEHIEYDTLMLRNWIDLLKKDGVLVLYLPDDDHYDNDLNDEHLQCYKYDSFIKDFNKRFSGRMKLINHGPDVGHDRYSFFMVAKRL